MFNPFVPALPMHEPIEDFPHEGENDPIEDFSPSHVAVSAQLKSGDRAIEGWPQTVGLPPVSGSSDAIITHDHPSPPDMDFEVPDAVSSYMSGSRDQDADRYNASSGTREGDASRHNAGSNPTEPTAAQVLTDRMRAATTLAQFPRI